MLPAAYTRLSDNEEDDFVKHMEIMFARAYRVRDVAYGNNWDDHLDEAMRSFLRAVEELKIAHSTLVG